MSIVNRFLGSSGHSLLVEALKDQFIVRGDSTVATELGKLVSVTEHSRGTRIITQGESLSGMFFIIAGNVSIEINGREIARRFPGQHVGEMALIDHTATRSASVICIDEVVVAHIEEPKFTALANSYPSLWRRLAIELANRLRQRSVYVRQKNEIPILFIGSSRESLPVLEAIKKGLDQSPLIVRPWTDPGVFRPSHFPIEDLAEQLRDADFAALVLGPDDQIISRQKQFEGPRDNVILELGLFMGAIERARTFLIVPRGVEIKIPTDLLGINPICFTPATLTPDVTSTCRELIAAITRLGCR